MADVSSIFEWDPAAYPQLDPQSPKINSLSIQPSWFWNRRAFPLRWTIHVPFGSGDLAPLNTPRLVTAINIPDDHHPMTCNDRVDVATEWGAYLIAPLFFEFDQLTIEVGFRTNEPEPTQWVWLFTMGRTWYPTFMASAPTATIGPVSGGQNGAIFVKPIGYFTDLGE